MGRARSACPPEFAHVPGSKSARCLAGGTEPYRARKGVPFVQVNVAQSSGFDDTRHHVTKRRLGTQRDR